LGDPRLDYEPGRYASGLAHFPRLCPQKGLRRIRSALGPGWPFGRHLRCPLAHHYRNVAFDQKQGISRRSCAISVRFEPALSNGTFHLSPLTSHFSLLTSYFPSPPSHPLIAFHKCIRNTRALEVQPGDCNDREMQRSIDS
jgi:hypothetical protein